MDVANEPESEFAQKYPTYGFSNIWPSELPELKVAFMELGTYIVDIGIMLARHCDHYVASKYPDLPPDLISAPLSSSSRTHKVASLFHSLLFFPL
jgi:hypothetical protein